MPLFLSLAGRAGRLGPDSSATPGCHSSKEGLSQVGNVRSDATVGQSGVRSKQLALAASSAQTSAPSGV